MLIPPIFIPPGECDPEIEDCDDEPEPPTEVPEPGTLMILFGAAIVTYFFYWRRRAV